MKSSNYIVIIRKSILKLPMWIRFAWFYFWGNIFADFIYDRKYLSGQHYTGKYRGIAAIGWRWAVTDCISRIAFGVNKGVPYPISPQMRVTNPSDIIFHTDDIHIFQSPGNYYNAHNGARIVFGRGCLIEQNVGIITANQDDDEHESQELSRDIILGENCRIGMNSVVLPGTTLGPHTIVSTGSVVNHCFPNGFCIIAGNPAEVVSTLKRLETETSK